MNMKKVMKIIKEKGVKYAFNRFFEKLSDPKCLPSIPTQNEPPQQNVKEREKTFEILLLTNRDSDNLGDQVIEACDIALISTAMENLNISKSNYHINSRAASIIPQKYIQKRDPKHLESAKKTIKNSDMIIFGGAPLFNYMYQFFYEKTALTLEIAQNFHKPVIFSAIGIEHYEDDNPKCQRLKKTLNFDCVKQITTRDNLEALQKYNENPNIMIGKVSDPAVFSNKVFEKHLSKPDSNKKTIGLFIIRANAFVDNDINFTGEQSAELWLNLIKDLKAKGYDYELLTSGHFGDEAFIDYLIRNHNVPLNKCVFNMNTPEKLVSKISSYNAIVSCRLHPSIIAYSLDVPSIGIVWNTKVNGFYNNIGYPDRIIETDGITPSLVLSKIEKAIEEGVQKDQSYLCAVYNTIFYSLQKIILEANTDIKPYSYEEILSNMPPYEGTTPEMLEEKLERKFRRTYNMYNTRFNQNKKLKKIINSLEKENHKLRDKFEKSAPQHNSKKESSGDQSF